MDALVLGSRPMDYEVTTMGANARELILMSIENLRKAHKNRWEKRLVVMAHEIARFEQEQQEKYLHERDNYIRTFRPLMTDVDLKAFDEGLALFHDDTETTIADPNFQLVWRQLSRAIQGNRALQVVGSRGRLGDHSSNGTFLNCLGLDFSRRGNIECQTQDSVSTHCHMIVRWKR